MGGQRRTSSDWPSTALFGTHQIPLRDRPVIRQRELQLSFFRSLRIIHPTSEGVNYRITPVRWMAPGQADEHAATVGY